MAQAGCESAMGASIRAYDRKDLFGLLYKSDFPSYAENIRSYGYQIQKGSNKAYDKAKKFLKTHKKPTKSNIRGYIGTFGTTYCQDKKQHQYPDIITNLVFQYKSWGIYKQ